VPWKFVEKLLFNKGLISDLILLGKSWALKLARTHVNNLFTHTFFGKKLVSEKFLPQ
jgi:hypothetical protein